MWHRAFHEIEFGRVPVVAALKGAVIGGGLELALSAHLRVAESSAFYALPEGQRGIFVGGGASVRLPRLIGVSRMRDMMLTGRVHDAESGERLGLSHRTVETHVQNTLRKLQLHNRSQLVRYAIEQGL